MVTLHSTTRNITIVTWVLVTAALWILYAWLPPNPDQENFDYIGLVGSWGGKYYVDSSDQNWPGVMLLHEIATRVLGVHIWSFRAFDFALLIIGAIALWYLLRSTGQIIASWIVLPLYELMYINSGVWFAGQRDIIAAHFLLVAAAVFSYCVRAKKPHLLVVTGAIVGYATLIRPTYLTNLSYLVGLLFLIPLIGNIRHNNTFKDSLLSTCWLLAGAISIVMIALLWGLASGNLQAWYEQAILFNLYFSFQARGTPYIDIVSRFSQYLFSWHWYLVFAVLGFISWIRRNGTGIELLASLGVAITGLISAFVQKAGFSYHLGAVLPVLALLTAAWLATVLELFLKRPTSYLAIGSLVLFWGIALLGIAKKTATFLPQINALVSGDYDRMLRTTSGVEIVPHDVQQAANFVRANTQPDDFVLVWSRHTDILYLSERRSTTHFSVIGMLTAAGDSFSLANNWFNQFRRELADNVPQLIILQTPASSEDNFDRFYSTKDVNRFVLAVRDLVKTQYMKLAEFGPFEIYGRRTNKH